MRRFVTNGAVVALLSFTVFWLAACSEKTDSEAESLRLAQFYLQDHQYREAIFSARKVLSRNPKNLVAYRIIGRSLLANGQSDEAERIFRAAIELGDRDPATRLDLARAMLQQGRAGAVLRYSETIRSESDAQKAALLLLRAEAYLNLDAIEAARGAVARALDLGAPREEALVALARINLADDKPDVALQLLDEVAAAKPDDPAVWHWRAQIALLQGRYAEAEEAFTRALEHDRIPVRRSRSVMGMMRAQIAQGKVESALQFAEQLEYNVDRTLPDFMRGLELFRAGKLDEAESALESVMEQHPGNRSGGMLLGAINFEKGNYSLAESYLSDYVTTDGSPLSARKMLAAIHLKQGRPREAFLLLQDTLNVEFNDPALDVLIGLSALGMGNYNLAEHHLVRAREHGRKSRTLSLGLARTWLATGKTRKAIGLAEEVLAEDEDSTLAKPIIIQGYLALGQGEHALKLARRWQKQAPYDVASHLLLARTAVSVGEIREAIAALQTALNIRSDNIEARLLLGDILLQQGRVEEARQHYRKILSLDPNQAAAARGLLMSIRSADEQKQVLDIFAAHLKAHPDVIGPRLMLAQYYLARNMFPTAEQVIRDVLALQADRSEALVLLAQVYSAQNRVDDALGIYDRLSALQPGSEKPLLAKARLLLMNKRVAQAVETARQATALNPDSATAWSLLFEAAHRAGDAGLRREALRQIQAKWPQQALAERLQGDALMRDGKPREALAYYEAAWKKQPVQDVALNLFAARLGAKREAAAFAGLENWLKRHPRDARARRLLANAYQHGGHTAEAMDHYRKLLEQNPGDIAVLNNLSWLYMEAGDRRALKLARRARDLAGDHPAVMDTYGMVLLRFGERDKAVAILEQAARLAPDDAEIAEHLAEARRGGG